MILYSTNSFFKKQIVFFEIVFCTIDIINKSFIHVILNCMLMGEVFSSNDVEFEFKFKLSKYNYMKTILKVIGGSIEQKELIHH